jgi:hypothetical protein
VGDDALPVNAQAVLRAEKMKRKKLKKQRLATANMSLQLNSTDHDNQGGLITNAFAALAIVEDEVVEAPVVVDQVQKSSKKSRVQSILQQAALARQARKQAAAVAVAAQQAAVTEAAGKTLHAQTEAARKNKKLKRKPPKSTSKRRNNEKEDTNLLKKFRVGKCKTSGCDSKVSNGQGFVCKYCNERFCVTHMNPIFHGCAADRKVDALRKAKEAQKGNAHKLSATTKAHLKKKLAERTNRDGDLSTIRKKPRGNKKMGGRRR